MRTKEQIRELLDSVLGKVNAPHAQAEYYYENDLASRFGENAITQNTGGAEENIRLVVAYGQQHGSSITNKMDGESLSRMVARAEDIARTSPPDPEYLPPVKPQTYPEVPQRFFDEVTGIEPADLADYINYVVQLARGAGFKASGLYEAKSNIQAVANSEGLFAFDKSTGLDYSTTIHGPRGSGHASANSESAKRINPHELAQKAFDNAKMAQNPVDIEPGDYTVIFEPQAVTDLLGFLLYNMSQRDADEGTTVFGGKVGEKMFSDKVNIVTRIDDPELPVPPFGEDGLAVKHTAWVEKGVVKRLRHDRYWASQKNTEPDPLLYPLFMDGEDQTVADLIAKCDRGLLLKRLWYIRYVDRKELLLTGMTRDGIYLIENGKVVSPVINLRWNESPVVFLKNVVAMSRPERVNDYAKVPGIMSTGFTFSSKTESL
ncbi:TldD/PmbA family protein [bacterium]|nr:TldD/PmbA family protein [bacterium]